MSSEAGAAQAALSAGLSIGPVLRLPDPGRDAGVERRRVARIRDAVGLSLARHALGGFHLAQAALPALIANGGGSLIFTGASGSLRGKANFAPFAAAKATLRNLAQSIAREFGPQGVHVGHVVIDGGIAGERLLSRRPELKDQRGPDGMLEIDAIAEAYWTLHRQHRSAWTLELDLRPWSETF